MSGKDPSIVQLVAALPMRERSWVLVDHWEADLFAIGVGRKGDERRLVYISTFKRAPGRYDYECETPSGPELTDFDTTEEGEDVGIDELVRAMVRHLAPRGR